MLLLLLLVYIYLIVYELLSSLILLYRLVIHYLTRIAKLRIDPNNIRLCTTNYTILLMHIEILNKRLPRLRVRHLYQLLSRVELINSSTPACLRITLTV